MIESLIQHARISARRGRLGTRGSGGPPRPGVLFIACSDARIVPTLITGAEPGQLFELRNVGNVVPPYRPLRPCGEGATIQYAVGILRVSEIVICGHTGCGAVQTLQPGGLRVNAFDTWWWLTRTNKRPHRRGTVPRAGAPADPGKRHLLAQREKLHRYPVVAKRVAAGELHVHSWYYDIGTGAIHVAQPEDDRFTPL
jgi:carbonic anhydrase